jgi:predicted exporter
LLVDQLRDGPLSRLLLIGIEGADATTRARTSRALAQRLRADSTFSMVNNGETPDAERDRRFLFDHRYALSPAVNPQRFSESGLRDAVQDSLDTLASPAGAALKNLLPADPTGETLFIVEQLLRSTQPRRSDGVWVSPQGDRALLIAQTQASGSDTDAQERAIASLRAAFDTSVAASAMRPQLIVSGPGVFAVSARAGIESAAKRLAGISALAIAALLFAVYRSVTALALGLVPVVCGALAGIAAVALGFGSVHGITLGFGMTLIGEAVDYSIYLFVQSRQGSQDPAAWVRNFWPTIRLGLLTSVIGFASLLPSGFPGLAQLGLYSIAGLVTAGLVTRFVLPDLLPINFTVRDLTPVGLRAQHVLPSRRLGWSIAALLFIAAASILVAHRQSLWNRDLSALSPVPARAQALDAQLRAQSGAAEAGNLLVVSASTEDGALRAAEAAGAVLEPLIDAGVIGGYDSPAQFLPSVEAQAARRASLPESAQLRARMRAALQETALGIDKIDPFFAAVEAARTAPPLTARGLQATSFAPAYAALMMRSQTRFNALLPLHAPASGSIDLLRVNEAIRQASLDAVALDLKRESDALYSSYLNEAVRLSLLGLAAISVLLVLTLRSARRLLQVMAPLLVAVCVVSAGLTLSGQQLTILHLIGMLLIVAIGSNYALFFTTMNTPATLASLLLANATTVIAFGVLATSSVPVLSALGQTVAPGALLALLFSALLSDRPARGD